MKILTYIFATAMFVSLCGCATTDEVVIDTTKRPPTSNVDVYKDGNLPERKFKEIAELSFLGPREDELRALKRFMKRAKEMGGNGIIFYTTVAGQKGGITVFQSTAYVFKGKVIIFE